MRTTLTCWAVLGILCLPAAAQAQTPAGGTGVPPVSGRHSDGRDARTTHNSPPSGAHTLDFPNFENVPYVIESGLLDNPSDDYQVVFSHEVHLPGAAWLRLFYDKAVLAGDSRVRVTSLLDGDVQELNAAILSQWSNTSAYFNGDRVLLELVAGPRTRGNELNLGQVQMQAGPAGGGVQTAAICGIDDRVPSYEDWTGRFQPEGCTGSIVSTSSCMVGAGHCAASWQIMQFRVPPSKPDEFGFCQLVNPPADDQFPILPGFQYNNNGVGDDWWVARVGANGLGQRPFDRYGQLRHVRNISVGIGARTLTCGFGSDSVCEATQTQQVSSGSIKVAGDTYYRFDNDITGGSSGTGLLFGNRVIGVVTHSTGACQNWNSGTKTGNPDFSAARAAVCPSCVTDLDGNGTTDQADLARLLAAYGSAAGQSGYDYVSDLDDDNLVGQSDLAALLAAYEVNCP